MAKGYAQIERIYFEETFAPVVRLELIRILLSIACFLKFKLYQMNGKSAFLNGILHIEVFVEQPEGFEDPQLPNYVYKIKKALYSLKQAPRAWYKRLINFLLDNHFDRESMDKTIFIKRKKGNILIVQIYVDDIIFGSTYEEMTHGFALTMKSKFEMSMEEELKFFVRLQVKQTPHGIFLSQTKFAKDLVFKFGLQESKPIDTPISTSDKITKD